MMKGLKERVAARLALLGRNPFLAAQIGDLERSFVNDILIGKKKSVRGDNLAKLARALDWSVAELVSDDQETEAGKVDPPLHRDQLEDNVYIQVSIGDLRTGTIQALRHGRFSETKAKALAIVLIEDLTKRPDVRIVLSSEELRRKRTGSRGPEPGGQL